MLWTILAFILGFLFGFGVSLFSYKKIRKELVEYLEIVNNKVEKIYKDLRSKL